MPVLADICRRLDGLPLAIELAAARIALFGPKDLLSRIENRLGVLADGARDLPDRQRSLRATLDWSYDLLSHEEQALYRRLGVFAGGCTLGGVQAFCELDGLAIDPLSGVGALVDKNLMWRGEFKSGQAHFGMLETMREHALVKLAALGESELWHERLAEFLIAQAGGDWGWMLESPDNWRTAMRWAGSAPSKSIEARLFTIVHEPTLSGAAHYIDGVLSRLDRDAITKKDHANVLSMAANISRGLGEYERARRLIDQAIDLRKTLSSPDELAATLDDAANAVREIGSYDEARAYLDEAIKLGKNHGLTSKVAFAYINLAEVEIADENKTEAREHLVRASELAQVAQFQYASEQSLFQIWHQNHMGHLELLGDNFALARHHLTRSLEMNFSSLSALSVNWANAWNYQGLAEVDLALGDAKAAADHIRYSLDALETVGEKMIIAWCLATLAGALVLDGEPERGAILWGAGEALRARLGCRIASASRKNRARTLDLLNARLGGERLSELMAEGGRMSVAEAARAGLGD
jgi:tetratricopeptide (TPR) repeat protein